MTKLTAFKIFFSLSLVYLLLSAAYLGVVLGLGLSMMFIIPASICFATSLPLFFATAFFFYQHRNDEGLPSYVRNKLVQDFLDGEDNIVVAPGKTEMHLGRRDDIYTEDPNVSVNDNTHAGTTATNTTINSTHAEHQDVKSSFN